MKVTAAEKLEMIRAVDALREQRPISVRAACKEVRIHRGNYERWSRQYREGGLEALEPRYKNSGRRPLSIPSEQEVQFARSRVLVMNRAEGAGSITAAAMALAEWEGCSEETRHAILKPRASVHTLTPTLRKAFAVDEHVIRYHRSPREVENALANRHGCMRMSRDGSRRLKAGERQSWDDGSINLLVCVPWPVGDDVCSRKFGVRLGRFQLLVGIDDATPYCPGFEFTMRPRQSYRGEDVCRAMARTWAETGKPAEVVLERGVWESKRVQEFLAAAGVEVTRAYRPNQKLIENYFNGLWTRLGELNGQIGRFRGEMEENAKLAQACKAGHKDPRRYFPSLPEVMTAIEQGITLRNRTPSESSIYGNHIPAEIWEEEAANRPRLKDDLSHFWLGEAKEWTVSRSGSVGGSVMSPFGFSIKYFFQSEGLWRHAGEKVRVFFDPFQPAQGATLVAMHDSRHARQGEVIARKADCISSAPSLVREMQGWEMDFRLEAAEIATRHRKQTLSAIRTEHRAIDPSRGAFAKTSSVSNGRDQFAEIKTGGRRTEVATRQPSPDAEDIISRTGNCARRATTPEPDIAETDRLESRLRKEGILL